MPVAADQALIAVVALLGLIVLLLVAWRLNISRQLQDQPPDPAPSREQLREARIESGERVAEPISEQIESMVQSRLAGEEGIAAESLDFGTEEDGSLAIWYEGVKYVELEAIPEPRVRQAVKEAVEAFNRPGQRR